MAQRPDPDPDENVHERIRKLSRENEELERKVTMETEARCLAEQREQDTERELSSVKEQLSSTTNALESERRGRQFFQGLYVDSQQVREELAIANVALDSRRTENETLQNVVAAKEAVNAELIEGTLDLTRKLNDAKEKLKISEERRMQPDLMVEENKRKLVEMKQKCDEFFWQVTRLIDEKQESANEVNLLRHEIDDLYKQLEHKEQWIHSAARNVSEAMEAIEVMTQQLALNVEDFAELRAENLALRDQVQEDQIAREGNERVMNVLLMMTRHVLRIMQAVLNVEEIPDRLE